MTQDEIIEMAIEAGLMGHQLAYADWYPKTLVAFANLVAAKATEEANARANASWELMCKKMVAFEREACAKVCESYIAQSIGKEMATVIRARGEQA